MIKQFLDNLIFFWSNLPVVSKIQLASYIREQKSNHLQIRLLKKATSETKIILGFWKGVVLDNARTNKYVPFPASWFITVASDHCPYNRSRLQCALSWPSAWSPSLYIVEIWRKICESQRDIYSYESLTKNGCGSCVSSGTLPLITMSYLLFLLLLCLQVLANRPNILQNGWGPTLERRFVSSAVLFFTSWCGGYILLNDK